MVGVVMGKDRSRKLLNDILTSGMHGDSSSPLMRRVRFTNVFAFTTAVALFVFAGVNLSKGNLLAFSVETGSALFGVAVMASLRRSGNIDRSQTLLLADIAVIMAFLFTTGGIARTGIFWWYTFPVAAFFIKGRKKGWYWIAGLLFYGILVKIFGESIGISVPFDFSILRQFMASFIVLSIVLQMYEATRDDYEKAIEENMGKLKKASANIRTLKGLVPICSVCKKIRDDKGFWQQLEVYVSEHTEADFSHGICEDCAAEMMEDQRKESGPGKGTG